MTAGTTGAAGLHLVRVLAHDGTDDRAKPTFINLAALSTASVETDDGQTTLTLTMLALQPGKERPHAQKLRVSGADAERLERALRCHAGEEPAG